MKISVNFNKFLNNWPVKAACFLVALCLYIFYTLSVQETRTFTVPLKIESSNGISPAESYPKTVKIKLKGKPGELSAIRESEISAYLNLNYLSKDGVYRLPVLVNLPQNALLLDTLEVHVSPQDVNLKVEESISGFVSINPLVNGTPARGYEIKNITIKPDTVEVTGPRSMVEHCKRLQTQPVSVKNAEVSFEKQVYPENLGSLLKLAGKEKVTVTVEIVPSGSTKKNENVPVSFENLKEGLEIYPSKVTARFTLTGNLLDLEKYNPSASVVYVDCSEISDTGTYELPVQYAVPDRFGVKETSIKSLKFDVRHIPELNEMEEKIIDETVKTELTVAEENPTGAAE